MQLQEEVLTRLIYLLGYEYIDSLESCVDRHQLVLSLLAERQRRIKCQAAQLYEQRVLTFLYRQLYVAVVD